MLIKKTVPFSVVSISLVSSLAFAQSPAKDPNVEWRSIESRSASSNLKVTGRITAGDGALKIESAGFAGRVVNVRVTEGDRVAVGQPLLEISSAECISLAEEKRVATQHGLADMVEASTRRAEQLHLKVQDSSSVCLLVAAHSATVLKRGVEIGTAFNVGDALVTLLDTTHLSAEFDVNERDLSLVHIGEGIRFQVAGDAATTMQSKITNIVPSIDPVTRVARVRVSGIRFARPTLDAQLIGEILVPVHNRSQASNDLSFEVPPEAVVFSKNRRFVIKGTVQKPVATEVRVLSEDSMRAFVQPVQSDDLKAGDRIAVSQAMYLLKRAQPESVD